MTRCVLAEARPAATSRPPRCRHRWPTCRWARPSARSCTPCWSTPTRRPRTSGPSCSDTSPSSWSGGRSTSTAEALADALVEVCTSPLGPLADDRTLLDLRLPDRLRELDFELPLAGGDVAAYPTVPVRLGDLAPLLRRHLPTGDPVLSYADTLDHDADLAGQPLLGYLTGSIDVVLRVGERFLTVDYKTNWLGDLDAPLSAHDYRPAVLDEAMGHSDYPLQALLYTVVLHRFLRWRLPTTTRRPTSAACSTSTSAACAGRTPRAIDGAPCGVFAWRPPVALVEELSALLDGALRRSVAMSELFEPVDEHDRDLALTAPPALAAVNAAGVITAADIHIATTLGSSAASATPTCCSPSPSPRAPCGTAPCAWSWPPSTTQLGDLDLTWPALDAWSAAIERSPLIGLGVLHWEHGLLYLDRYHEQETQVLDDLTSRAASTPPHRPRPAGRRRWRGSSRTRATPSSAPPAPTPRASGRP